MRFQGRYIRDCKRRAAGQKLHQERANIRQNSDRWNWATHGKRPYRFFHFSHFRSPLTDNANSFYGAQCPIKFISFVCNPSSGSPCSASSKQAFSRSLFSILSIARHMIPVAAATSFALSIAAVRAMTDNGVVYHSDKPSALLGRRISPHLCRPFGPWQSGKV